MKSKRFPDSQAQEVTSKTRETSHRAPRCNQCEMEHAAPLTCPPGAPQTRALMLNRDADDTQDSRHLEPSLQSRYLLKDTWDSWAPKPVT